MMQYGIIEVRGVKFEQVFQRDLKIKHEFITKIFRVVRDNYVDLTGMELIDHRLWP